MRFSRNEGSYIQICLNNEMVILNFYLNQLPLLRNMKQHDYCFSNSPLRLIPLKIPSIFRGSNWPRNPNAITYTNKVRFISSTKFDNATTHPDRKPECKNKSNIQHLIVRDYEDNNNHPALLYLPYLLTLTSDN